MIGTTEQSEWFKLHVAFLQQPQEGSISSVISQTEVERIQVIFSVLIAQG